MNQKDLIKYALIAVGAYLVYKYIQDHGGIEGLFGSVGATGTGSNLTTAQCAQMLAGQSTVDGSAAKRALLAGAGVTLTADQELQIKSCGAAALSATQLAAISHAQFSRPVPTDHANNIQPVPAVLDTAGLIVTQDVNDSLSGTVRLDGVPVRLSIITSDGRIFDGTGTEVTASLQGRGINVVALRTAFQSAPQVAAQPTGESLAGMGWGNPWTN